MNIPLPNFKDKHGLVVDSALTAHGQKAVTTAGTELALAATTAVKFGVWIKALRGNTGFIYVGLNPVGASTGYELDAGEEVFVPCADLADVFIDSSVSGESVCYLAF